MQNNRERGLLEKEITSTELDTILSTLTSQPTIFHQSRTCFLMGYGNHRRSTYLELKQNRSLNVIWFAPFLPRWLYLLGRIIPSYGGLVEIKNPSALRPVFEILSRLAMVEFYSVKVSVFTAIVTHVQQYQWRSQTVSIARNDESYFRFGVDGDTMSAESIFSWVSYGPQSPLQVRDLPILRDFSQRCA